MSRLSRRVERDENTCREEMRPSEKVALGRALEALERPMARERQDDGRKAGGEARHGQLPENFTPSSRPPVRDIVGAAIGMSGVTYARAKRVVQASEDESLSAEGRGYTTDIVGKAVGWSGVAREA